MLSCVEYNPSILISFRFLLYGHKPSPHPLRLGYDDSLILLCSSHPRSSVLHTAFSFAWFSLRFYRNFHETNWPLLCHTEDWYLDSRVLNSPFVAALTLLVLSRSPFRLLKFSGSTGRLFLILREQVDNSGTQLFKIDPSGGYCRPIRIRQRVIAGFNLQYCLHLFSFYFLVYSKGIRSIRWNWGMIARFKVWIFRTSDDESLLKAKNIAFLWHRIFF
jgi:hypothetical protein